MAAVIVWGAIGVGAALTVWMAMVGNIKVERIRVEEEDEWPTRR